MSYRLTYSIPYEGQTSHDFITLDAVKTWIRNNRTTIHNLELDDLEIIEIARDVDVFELMDDKP